MTMRTPDCAATDELSCGQSLAKGAYVIARVKRATNCSFNYVATTADGASASIREFYLPDVCQRDGLDMRFKSKDGQKLFRKMVKGFIDDARYLKSLENPHIAVVSDVFEENGTAYMVSAPPEGKTLEDLLAEGKTFKPVEVARAASHLFSALIEIHSFGMLHRDISPKNIKFDQNGAAVLLADFSTFREDKSKVSQVVSSVLRAQSVHAPLEFIFEGSEQNEASDVFSLASVIYLMMTGNAPVPCQDRLACVAADKPDPYQPLDGAQPAYDAKFLRTIDLSLALLNENRVRSANEFLNCFAKGEAIDQFDKLRLEAARCKPKKRGLLSVFGWRGLLSFLRF
jgi:serine/threonine protein kinase